MRECTRQLAFAHLRVATAIAMDLTVFVLQLGGLLLLAALGRLSVAAAFLVLASASALGAACWFARWALAGMLFASLTPHITPWLLTHWHDVRATGLLAASAALVGPAQMFQFGMSNYLAPQAAAAFAQGGHAQLARMLVKGAALLGLGIGAIAGVFAALGGPLLVLLYGPAYAGGGPIVASGRWSARRPISAPTFAHY